MNALVDALPVYWNNSDKDGKVLESDTWEDITQAFTEETAEMEVGSMTHGDDFDLFDSMSAIELMDPKMDGGMLLENEGIIRTVASRYEMGELELDVQNPRDVLCTMDYIVRCETSYWNGQTLSQSLLLCTYLHHPVLKILLEKEFQGWMKVFSAFVVAVAGMNHTIRSDIITADLYQEEDFCPATYHVDWSVQGELMLDVCLQKLEDAIKFVKQNVKSEKEKEIKRVKEAIMLRLKCRKAFILGIVNVHCTPFVDHREEMNKQFNGALNLMNEIKEEQMEFVYNDTSLGGKRVGIDENLARLLATSSPPPKIQVMEFTEAVEYRMKVLRDVVYIYEPRSFEDITALMAMLQHYSLKRPTILPRTYMLIYLSADEKLCGSIDATMWVINSLSKFGVPQAFYMIPEGRQALDQTVGIILELLSLFLSRLSRRRQRLEFIMQDVVALQQLATVADAAFLEHYKIPKSSYPNCFTAFCNDKLLMLMIQYINIGFDVELYEPYEYPFILWYIDGLFELRKHTITNLHAYLLKLEKLDAKDDSPKQKSNTNKTSRQSSTNESANSFAWLELETELLELHQLLSRGLCKFVLAVQNEGGLLQPKHSFGSMENRYKHRFEPFTNFESPPFLSYDLFLKSTSFSNLPGPVLFLDAAECYKQARLRIAKCKSLSSETRYIQDDMNAIAKVAITNGIHIQRLVSTVFKQDAKALLPPVQFSFSVHQTYPTIS